MKKLKSRQVKPISAVLIPLLVLVVVFALYKLVYPRVAPTPEPLAINQIATPIYSYDCSSQQNSGLSWGLSPHIDPADPLNSCLKALYCQIHKRNSNSPPYSVVKSDNLQLQNTLKTLRAPGPNSCSSYLTDDVVQTMLQQNNDQACFYTYKYNLRQYDFVIEDSFRRDLINSPQYTDGSCQNTIHLYDLLITEHNQDPLLNYSPMPEPYSVRCVTTKDNPEKVCSEVGNATKEELRKWQMDDLSSYKTKITLYSTAAPTTQPAATPNIDFDHNNIVNQLDYDLFMAAYNAKDASPTSPADMDKNQVINRKDYNQFMKLYRQLKSN